EYELADDLASASLTRRPDVSGDRLFSAASGYIERRVKTADDLRAFLSEANDLTYARRETDGVTLGGRRFRAHTYRGVTIEDVAAIWQSEAGKSSHGSGFSLDPQFDWDKLADTAKTLVEPALDRRSLWFQSSQLTAAVTHKDIEGYLKVLNSLCDPL